MIHNIGRRGCACLPSGFFCNFLPLGDGRMKINPVWVFLFNDVNGLGNGKKVQAKFIVFLRNRQIKNILAENAIILKSPWIFINRVIKIVILTLISPSL